MPYGFRIGLPWGETQRSPKNFLKLESGKKITTHIQVEGMLKQEPIETYKINFTYNLLIPDSDRFHGASSGSYGIGP